MFATSDSDSDESGDDDDEDDDDVTYVKSELRVEKTLRKEFGTEGGVDSDFNNGNGGKIEVQRGKEE